MVVRPVVDDMVFGGEGGGGGKLGWVVVVEVQGGCGEFRGNGGGENIQNAKYLITNMEDGKFDILRKTRLINLDLVH